MQVIQNSEITQNGRQTRENVKKKKPQKLTKRDATVT